MKKSAVEACAVVGRQLGRGSHATVWEFSKNGALKVVKGKARSKAETERLKTSIRHELYIHRHVRGISAIAPELKSTWKCNGMSFFLYPRYEGDMKALGEKQLEEDGRIKPSRVYQQVLFTEPQLLRMFQLAKRLGQEFRVLHGDLRMEQYFYKSEGEDIVVADFGFSGYFPARGGRNRYAEWGWFLCPDCPGNDSLNTKLPVKASLIPRYLQAFNQFQLLADLTANGVRCYVKRANGDIMILGADKRLSSEFAGSQEMQYVGLPRGVKRYRLPRHLLS